MIESRETEEYKNFIINVFKRDGYKCVICNNKKNIVPHHLDSYDINVTGREKTENGVTLCKPCHMRFHDKYGYGNNTKEQFYEHYKFLEYKKMKDRL